jgi:hypothetical protein
MNAEHSSHSWHHTVAVSGTALLCLLALPALAAPRQVNEARPASADGVVEIVNVAGLVEVSGWDKPTVEVTGTIGDKVERVEVTGTAGRTAVHVVLPSGNHSSWSDFGEHGPIGSGEARLRIQVPQKSSLVVSLVSANLRIAGVAGNQHLQTVSGDISGDGGGTLQISTVSGDVHLVAANARTAQIETISGDMTVSGAGGDVSVHTVSGDGVLNLGTVNRARFETVSGDLKISAALAADAQFDAASVSGDVAVQFNANPDAEFDLQSFSGDISNCFGPRPAKEEYGPGTRLAFRNGKGGGRVHVDTQSGDVSVCTKK